MAIKNVKKVVSSILEGKDVRSCLAGAASVSEAWYTYTAADDINNTSVYKRFPKGVDVKEVEADARAFGKKFASAVYKLNDKEVLAVNFLYAERDAGYLAFKLGEAYYVGSAFFDPGVVQRSDIEKIGEYLYYRATYDYIFDEEYSSEKSLNSFNEFGGNAEEVMKSFDKKSWEELGITASDLKEVPEPEWSI